MIGVVRSYGREDFEGDAAVGFGVARAVDLSHFPGAKRPEDFVGAEFVAGRQRHEEPE